MTDDVLRLWRVTYREKDNDFLRDFDLDVRTGEIMGLLPLNLYGLPALLEVIQENPPLYFGTVWYQGEIVNSWRDMPRRPSPVTVVDKVSSLVSVQNILTNIFLLRQESHFFVSEKKLEKELRPYLEEIGVDISPWTRAEDLTAFQRVAVEILRGVIWGHRLIILREVSSFIGENKLEELYRIMDICRKKGISFLFISSHYEEIRSVCDRAAVMSNGRILMKLDVKTESEQLKAVCTKDNQKHSAFQKEDIDPDKVQPVLEMRALEGKCFDRTDIAVYEGEYLVLHTPEVRIFDELGRIIFGEDSGGGYVILEGKKTNPRRTREIAYLRANAEESMLFGKMSYMDNLLFTADHKASSVWRSSGVKKSIRQEFSGMLGEDIFSRRVDTLSRREKITLVYTRVLLQHPRVVFCEMPFMDEDPGMKLLIRDLQRRLNENRVAVVVLTMNLNENILDADRVIRIGEKHTQ